MDERLHADTSEGSTMKLLWLACCCHLIITQTAADGSRRRSDQNINPQPPLFAAAQLVIAANGAVELTSGQLPFPDIFVDSEDFFRRELKFTTRHISRQRGLAERAWIRDFNISASLLEPQGDVVVRPYQITSDLNTNSHLATNPCYTPAEGYETLEGGFYMMVTNPNGILVTQDGVVREVTPNTSFFYSWFVLKNIRRNRNDCPGVVRARTRSARSLISQILGGRSFGTRNNDSWRPTNRQYQRNRNLGSRSPRRSRGNGDRRDSSSSSSSSEEDDDEDGLPPRNIVLQYKTLQPSILLNSSGFAEVSIFSSNYEVFELGKGLVVDGVPKHISPGNSRLDLLRCIHILFQ